MFEIAGRAKWDAWSKTGKEYEDRRVDAETRYLAIAREQGWESGVAPSSTPPPPDEEEGWDEELGMSIADPTDGGGGGGGGDGGMGVSVSAPLRPESERAGGLHEMAIDGDAERLSRFLVEARGVDVDARDEFVGGSLVVSLSALKLRPGGCSLQGYTALHLACDRGNLGVVEILLEHGGDPMLKVPTFLLVAAMCVCVCLTWLSTGPR